MAGADSHDITAKGIRSTAPPWGLGAEYGRDRAWVTPSAVRWQESSL